MSSSKYVTCSHIFLIPAAISPLLSVISFDSPPGNAFFSVLHGQIRVVEVHLTGWLLDTVGVKRFKCCFNSTHFCFSSPCCGALKFQLSPPPSIPPQPICVRQWAVITKLLFSSENQSPQCTAPPHPPPPTLSVATRPLSPPHSRLSYFLLALLLTSLSSFHLIFIIYRGAALL